MLNLAHAFSTANSASFPHPFRGPKSIRVPVAGWAAALLVLGTLFAGCSGSAPEPKPQPEWRLVPEATVLAENRQFFLYGRRLDSVTITVPPSVAMVRGKSANGGRVLSLHFRVLPWARTPWPKEESVGLREVGVKTPDTSAGVAAQDSGRSAAALKVRRLPEG